MTDRLLVALARLATLPLHVPAKRAQQWDARRAADP